MDAGDEIAAPETLPNNSSNETGITEVSEVLSAEFCDTRSENPDKILDEVDALDTVDELSTENAANSKDKLDQNSTAVLVETSAEDIDKLDQNSAEIPVETPAEIKTESLKRPLEDLSDENSDSDVISSKIDEKPGSNGYFVDKAKAEWFRSIVSYGSSDSESDSESSSSSSECSEKSNELDSAVLSDIDCKSEDSFVQSPKKYEIPRTKGELSLDELPPIEDLKISVTEHEMVQMGVVHAIVDNLVVVQSDLNFPALDLDSVIFFSDGKPLGKVFDVLGPVIQPLYSVRFNNADHIKSKGIEKNMPVFCAPNVVDATSFVFIAQLVSLKGSDASWQDNNEPPAQFMEYSDDEEERRVKAAARNHSDQSSDKLPCKKPIKERKCLQTQRCAANSNAPVQGGSPSGGTQELPVVRPHGNFQLSRPSFQPNFSQTGRSYSDSAAQFRPRESPNYSHNLHNSSQYMPSQSYPRFPPHRFNAPLFPFRYGHPPQSPRGDFNPMNPVNQDFQNQKSNFPPPRF